MLCGHFLRKSLVIELYQGVAHSLAISSLAISSAEIACDHTWLQRQHFIWLEDIVDSLHQSLQETDTKNNILKNLDEAMMICPECNHVIPSSPPIGIGIVPKPHPSVANSHLLSKIPPPQVQVPLPNPPCLTVAIPAARSDTLTKIKNGLRPEGVSIARFVSPVTNARNDSEDETNQDLELEFQLPFRNTGKPVWKPVHDWGQRTLGCFPRPPPPLFPPLGSLQGLWVPFDHS